MEPFSPKDLAMREWARRFLKNSSITTLSPSKLTPMIQELHLFYNDETPSQYSEITVLNHNLDVIKLQWNGINIGQIGGDVPKELSSVYIPTDNIVQTWSEMEKITRELISAGYPGCVGCGGPGAEEEWDEIRHRKIIFN
tara:strand:- start:113 stop:532 length:420 start_codon:yes stop_codon:yes gene_type:complete